VGRALSDLILRYTSRTLFIDRWSGTVWEDLSGPMQGASVPGGSQFGDLAIHAPSNRWFAAFQERKAAAGQASAGAEVYVVSGGL
jgi:hypothetical protein